MTEPAQNTQEDQLEGGTYEIIRNRLTAQGKTLRQRLDHLNQARKDAFGSIETKLVGSERVNTDNNCTPRDMVPVGGRFIFGYNVHMGLRSEMGLQDVFSVYQFSEGRFHQLPLDLIQDERFEADFLSLYKYYKNTVFSKFAVIGPHLFMKFHVGKGRDDFKTFKWLLEDQKITYLDNRSDHEFKYPPQHEFEWQRSRRDFFRMGAHPHISIEDRVFVETIGGDLTIKVEDNTDSGRGILVEPVDNPDQTLDDADIHYASVGPVILLKILPYREKDWRYFVFNEKLQEALRIDAIADACVLLPDSHGLIFPKGYYLLTGEYKEFESDLQGMSFEKRIVSPNGEDFIYVFYNSQSGTYILLPYNLIEQTVKAPIICHGYSLFEDGSLVYFKAEEEPSKHHVLQIWQTSFTGPNLVRETHEENPLFKIGNKDIVRCMAECHEVLTLIKKEETYANLYLDMAKKTVDIADSYFWLKEADDNQLSDILVAIGETANAAIEEFEKVNRIKKATRDELDRVTEKSKTVLSKISRARFTEIDEFVVLLAELRTLRGEIVATGQRRYSDTQKIEALEQEARDQTESLSNACVTFLLEPKALEPYEARVASQEKAIGSLEKVSDGVSIEQDLLATSKDLELLIEIVSNLKINDATPNHPYHRQYLHHFCGFEPG